MKTKGDCKEVKDKRRELRKLGIECKIIQCATKVQEQQGHFFYVFILYIEDVWV